MSLVASKINNRRSAPTDLKRKIVQESNFLGEILDQCTIKKKQKTTKKLSSSQPSNKVSQEDKKLELIKNNKIEVVDKPRVSSSRIKPSRRSEPIIKQSLIPKKTELPRTKDEVKKDDVISHITPDKKKQYEIERKYKRLSTQDALALLYKSKDKNKSKDEKKRKSESHMLRDMDVKKEPIKLKLVIPKTSSPTDGNVEPVKRKEEPLVKPKNSHIPSKEKKTSPSVVETCGRSSPTRNSISSHNSDLEFLFNKMNTFQSAPSFVPRPVKTAESHRNKSKVPLRESRVIKETNNLISPDSTSYSKNTLNIIEKRKETEISSHRESITNPPYHSSKSNIQASTQPIPRNQLHTKEHTAPSILMPPPPPKTTIPRMSQHSNSFTNNSVALSKSQLRRLNPNSFLANGSSTKPTVHCANITSNPKDLSTICQSAAGKDSGRKDFPPPSNNHIRHHSKKTISNTISANASIQNTGHNKPIPTAKSNIPKIAFVKSSSQVSSEPSKNNSILAEKEKPLSIETTSISIIPKFETLSGSESEDEDSFIIPRLEPLPQIITEMPTTPKYEHLSSSSDNDSSDDNSSSSGSSSGSSSSSDDSNSSSSDSE
ncbi:uncharacterized protein [Lepeophtheirus salmonis]|uniref:uncharacterized protein isoform X2 n=1 Tax=Lepeophtheirus salmonis TaxID=72036 RepID=UPI001AE6AF9F|nr:serine-rich adhesin for platelets-like isoform X2 [Lepeophtheirus salmonis]